MKRGIGKYKGKLPLACFYCGEIGHFATKCPHKNETYTKRNKGQHNFKKKKGFKKNLFSKEDSSSSEEESGTNEENKERVLFMAKHKKKEALDENEDEEEEMFEIKIQNEVVRSIKKSQNRKEKCQFSGSRIEGSKRTLQEPQQKE